MTVLGKSICGNEGAQLTPPVPTSTRSALLTKQTWCVITLEPRPAPYCGGLGTGLRSFIFEAFPSISLLMSGGNCRRLSTIKDLNMRTFESSRCYGGAALRALVEDIDICIETLHWLGGEALRSPMPERLLDCGRSSVPTFQPPELVELTDTYFKVPTAELEPITENYVQSDEAGESCPGVFDSLSRPMMLAAYNVLDMVWVFPWREDVPG